MARSISVHDRRVIGTAQVPERGGQVGGTDEDSVDSVDRAMDSMSSRSLLGLHLHEDGDPFIGVLQVGRVAVPTRRLGQCRTYAADSPGGYASPGRPLRALRGAVDHGNQEVADPDIQQLFDLHPVRRRWAGPPRAPGMAPSPVAEATGTSRRWGSARCL